MGDRARTWIAVSAAVLALASCGSTSDTVDGASGEAAATTMAATSTDGVDGAAPAGSSGPTVLIDTDLSLWWDDASVIGMANVLEQRGELRILGVVTDVPNANAVAAIDAIGTAYGNPDVPLGAVAGSGEDTFDHGYTDALTGRLPHSVEHSDDVPEAVALSRQLLAGEPDGSVTVLAIGGSTNLAALLASPADEASELDGRALVAAKVERLVLMDGLFPDGGPPLTNQQIDPAALAAVVTGDWPTPIAWFDGFGGIQTTVGGTLCAQTAPEHPMRIVYEELFGCGSPGDGNWDAPTLLYAIGDMGGAFEELGQGGSAVINESGGLSWETPSTRPGDVYVRVVDQESVNDRIDELLVAG